MAARSCRCDWLFGILTQIEPIDPTILFERIGVCWRGDIHAVIVILRLFDLCFWVIEMVRGRRSRATLL
jgi:hypothetical protein